ncbi:MAG TPA: hypothetical protein VK741_20435 [Acetobacteraceae bacterium]|jgi:hypothetical protein|nr:hypothetical protein [Acetobacteraceae bacterium]
MNILRSGHSLRHELTDSIEPARSRRYPPNAVRFRSEQVRQSGGMGPIRHAEQKPAASSPASHRKPAKDRARGRPDGVVVLIFCIGLALEATLPWAMIWLSDEFVFDTPAWSSWLVFALPAVLTVLVLVLYEILRARSGQLSPTPIRIRQHR